MRVAETEGVATEGAREAVVREEVVMAAGLAAAERVVAGLVAAERVAAAMEPTRCSGSRAVARDVLYEVEQGAFAATHSIPSEPPHSAASSPRHPSPPPPNPLACRSASHQPPASARGSTRREGGVRGRRAVGMLHG